MNSRGNAHMNFVMKRGNRQKPRDVKHTLRRLWDYLYKFKFLILLALFLTIFANLFALVGPKLLGFAIDAMRMKDDAGNFYVDIDKVKFYALLMLIFYVLSSILSYFLARLMTYIGKRVVYKMREDAAKRLGL